MGAPLVYGHPDTWEGFAYVVTAEQFRGDVLPLFGDLGRKVAGLTARGSAELGLLAPLVPAGFLATVLRRPRFALLSGLAFTITCLFNASYVNAAIDRYYLVPLLLAVSWLGVGVAAVADAVVPREAPRAGTPSAGSPWASPAVLVAALVGLAILAGPALLAAPASFRQADRSTDVTARSWVDGVLATLPEGALIQSWWSFSTPLWYATLVEGRRPDVTVIDDRDLLDENLGTVDDLIEANLGRRPVFVVRPDVELFDLARRWVLERWSDPAGIQPLWQVVARQGTEP
jgi:hypothetical protein